MSRAVHGLIEDGVVAPEAIYVSRVTMAGDRPVAAPPQRSGIGLGGVVGGAIGLVVSFTLLLVAMLWTNPSASQVFMVLLTGGGYGAVLGAGAMAFYDPQRNAAVGAVALYRDFLVSVDVSSDRQLANVRRALAGTGGELIA